MLMPYVPSCQGDRRLGDRVYPTMARTVYAQFEIIHNTQAPGQVSRLLRDSARSGETVLTWLPFARVPTDESEMQTELLTLKCIYSLCNRGYKVSLHR